jgi:O-acetyl-ADP-ribose deacetylase
MDLLINRTRIFVESEEFIAREVDAVIHPTNTFLWFASGFSETLKRLGGAVLEQEAITLGPLAVGSAVAASPGRLKCRMLIHAVAWGQDMMTDVKKIHQAVSAALELASRNHCLTVMLPPVGADVGRFPLPKALEATFLSMIEHCLSDTTVREIHFLARDRTLETILNQLIQTALSASPPLTSGEV